MWNRGAKWRRCPHRRSNSSAGGGTGGTVRGAWPLLVLLVLAGCTPPKPPAAPRRQWFTSTSRPSAQASLETLPAEDLPLLLRNALLPPTSPQPFTITLSEQLQTQPESGPPTLRELRIELSGTLAGEAPNPRGESRAVLTLANMAVHYRGPDPPGQADFDSEQGGISTARLTELLSQAVGANLTLALTPRARLRELTGMDTLWRPSETLALPPAARVVLARFRNTPLGELVGEALFPPMPGGTLRMADRWEAEVLADIPGIAPLTSLLTGRIAARGQNAEGLPVVHMQLTGAIKPSSVAVGWSTRGVELRSGKHLVDLHVDWNTRSLRQESHREIELTRPLGTGAGAPLTVRQTRTLIASRGRIETAPAP